MVHLSLSVVKNLVLLHLLTIHPYIIFRLTAGHCQVKGLTTLVFLQTDVIADSQEHLCADGSFAVLSACSQFMALAELHR